MATATPEDVAANVGRELSAAELVQVALWIGWAEATIQRRMDLATLDPATLQMVVVEAVSRRLKMPDPVTQMSVQVDEAMVSRSYTKATGLIDILPEWWEALGWHEGGAFSVRPYGEPDIGWSAW